MSYLSSPHKLKAMWIASLIGRLKLAAMLVRYWEGQIGKKTEWWMFMKMLVAALIKLMWNQEELWVALKPEERSNMRVHIWDWWLSSVLCSILVSVSSFGNKAIIKTTQECRTTPREFQGCDGLITWFWWWTSHMCFQLLFILTRSRISFQTFSPG